MKSPHLLGCASLLCIGLMSSDAMATEFYKWVDAKGVTHYTKTPPPKNAKKVGKVDTYGWKNSVPTPAQSSTPNAESKPAKEENSAPAAQNQSQQNVQQAVQPPAAGKLL